MILENLEIKQMNENKPKRMPPWIRSKLSFNNNSKDIIKAISHYSLNTVCASANCPNLCECFSERTATLMILGNVCTRNCAFCGVDHLGDKILDKEEPKKVAKFVLDTGLEYVVITSVTRDDLPDGGAQHFAGTIFELKKIKNDIMTEVLVPDFAGDKKSVDTVLASGINVFAHNMETVKRLYSKIRPAADYSQSLEILKYASNSSYDVFVKSGIMLGLGETKQEVLDVINDMYKAGVDFLTIGQYLRPDRDSVEVSDFIEEDMFEYYRKYALDLGFLKVASGSFVRSSYKAKEFFTNQ